MATKKRKGRYAEGTKTLIRSTVDEINRTLERYGVDHVQVTQTPFGGDVAFRWKGVAIRMGVRYPDAEEDRFRKDSRGFLRTTAEREKAFDAEKRRLWRVLVALRLKPMLELEQEAAGTLDEGVALIPYVVPPGGATMADQASAVMSALLGGAPSPFAALPPAPVETEVVEEDE